MGDYHIYNPGTIMAEYFPYMCFIKQMIEVLILITKVQEGGNWNMMIATYLIRSFLSCGVGFTSLFLTTIELFVFNEVILTLSEVARLLILYISLL